ncbi:hypothetical protein [Nonomuraea deserti]|nr:hypothetical protein [Nonomuraea deserti]
MERRWAWPGCSRPLDVADNEAERAFLAARLAEVDDPGDGRSPER